MRHQKEVNKRSKSSPSLILTHLSARALSTYLFPFNFEIIAFFPINTSSPTLQFPTRSIQKHYLGVKDEKERVREIN